MSDDEIVEAIDEIATDVMDYSDILGLSVQEIVNRTIQELKDRGEWDG